MGFHKIYINLWYLMGNTWSDFMMNYVHISQLDIAQTLSLNMYYILYNYVKHVYIYIRFPIVVDL